MAFPTMPNSLRLHRPPAASRIRNSQRCPFSGNTSADRIDPHLQEGCPTSASLTLSQLTSVEATAAALPTSVLVQRACAPPHDGGLPFLRSAVNSAAPPLEPDALIMTKRCEQFPRRRESDWSCVRCANPKAAARNQRTSQGNEVGHAPCGAGLAPTKNACWPLECRSKAYPKKG
jgi:hypothetical protein